MSANLNAPALVGGQANPETTVNDAIGALDAALTETVVVDLTTNVAMTSAVYRSAIRFSITPAGTSRVLTLPAVKRLVCISNDSSNSISVKVGSTTIAMGVGSSGFFITDGTTNGLLQLGAAGTGTTPFDVGVFIAGLPGDGGTVLRFNVVRAFTWPSGLTGSIFNAGGASGASAVFTINKNGSPIGTITFSTSSTGTVSFSSAVTFAVNDVITIVAPSPQDASLADVGFNFMGLR